MVKKFTFFTIKKPVEASNNNTSAAYGRFSELFVIIVKKNNNNRILMCKFHHYFVFLSWSRSVARTKMNDTSSRSHFLVMLKIHGVNKVRFLKFLLNAC